MKTERSEKIVGKIVIVVAAAVRCSFVTVLAVPNSWSLQTDFPAAGSHCRRDFS